MRRNKRNFFLRILLCWGGSLGIALVVPFLLRRLGFTAPVDSELMAFGVDPERVILLDYLLLTLLGSAFAGFFLQRRRPAWVGGLLYFILRYLIPFTIFAQHPDRGPAGQIQVIILGALFNAQLTLLALALLCAGVGAVIGEAFGQIAVAPFITLGTHLWLWIKRKIRTLDLSHRQNSILLRSLLSITPDSFYTKKIPSLGSAIASLFLAGLLIGAWGTIATNGGPLLMYGPTANLYRMLQDTSINPAFHHNLLRHDALASPGTLEEDSYTSPALDGVQRKFWIYLPPSYATEVSRRYPTLYLLHGSPGTPYDWFGGANAGKTEDALLAEHKMRETILISPDGSTDRFPSSEWANSFDNRQRMEDSIVNDLVPFIDSHYRTLADATDRAIGGISMGGYGAINITLHHPMIFHEVLSFGGYFQAEGPVFGTGPASASYRQLNSPSLFLQTAEGAKAVNRLTIVIGAGTTDKLYYHNELAFYQQLHAMNADVRLIINVGGHAWPLWANQLGEALPILEPPSVSLIITPHNITKTADIALASKKEGPAGANP